MPKIPIGRGVLLIAATSVIALVAIACESAAEKPTAEPPTPIPTVATQVGDTGSSLSVREALADPEVLECLSEQLGGAFDPDSGAVGPELFGRLGAEELAMLESCGVDADGATRGVAPARADFSDPELQECLAGELGIDVVGESGEFDREILRSTDPTDVAAAFEACGVEQGIRPGGALGGGLAGGGFADPEIRECLTEELGENRIGQLGQGSGLGLEEESLAAFEKCGLDFGGIGGGFRFGDGERPGGDDGIFGDGRGGRGDGITLGDDFRECMAEALGDDASTLLRGQGGQPPAELQEAFAQCGSGEFVIPVEPDGGIGDGAGPIPVEPAEEPTATPIPASELTIEQLTCLSNELDPAALANAVIATSSGDLAEISDEILAALQSCGVGT